MTPHEITPAQARRALPSASWLDVLHHVLPVRGVLLVGAGNGSSTWVQWFIGQTHIPAWLVEGDEAQYRHLQRHALPGNDWVLRRDVVAATKGAATFYCASNPTESGLIAPERLRDIWPHLKQDRIEPEAAAVTLDELWDEAGQVFNWLIVDCLPAATLLEGGGRLLAQADVVVLRVVTGDHIDAEPAAHHAAAEAILNAAGLRCAQLWPQRHPSLAHALYVRDVARQAKDLARGREEATRAQDEVRQVRLAVEQMRAAHKAQLDDLSAVADRAVEQAREDARAQDARIKQLTQELTALENDKSALAAQCDEQMQLAAVRGKALATLKLAHTALEQDKTAQAARLDEQAKLAAEQSQEIDALKQTKVQLEQEIMALAARYEEQARLSEERQSQLEQLADDKSAIELDYVREIQVLKLARQQLEEEKADLAARHEKQAQLAVERQTKIEQLEQAAAVAESESNARIAEHQKKSNEYFKELENLKSKVATLQKEKGGLGDMVRDLVPFFYNRRLTYVDIGAYVGDVFLAFFKSELTIREAHLIEPNSHTYPTLVENTSGLLKNGSLHHYCLAIDRQPGQVVLVPGSSMSRTVPLHSSDLNESGGKDPCVIDSTTLDLLVDRITENHIDLLKIDVEGFEENVLLGAQNVLHRQLVDVVVIEVGMNPDGKQQCYYRKIDDLMQEAGYRIFRVYDQMYEWISDSPFMRRANFVYMSESFAKSSPYRLTHELYKKEKTIDKLKSQAQ